jgi:thiol-disulfide isomerase/thioredoxin
MQTLTSILRYLFSYSPSYSTFITHLSKPHKARANMFFMLLVLLLTLSTLTARAAETARTTETARVTETARPTETARAIEAARAIETARASKTEQKSPVQQAALKMAPSWSLYDAEGNLVSSKDFAGKPLIIHFWATWCPYCKKLQPGLDRLFEKYQDQGLQMIAISLLEEEGAKPQETLTARGMSFKTLVGGDSVAMEKFFVRGTPTTFFINAKGQVVVATRLSDPNDPRLEQVVKSLMVN